MSVPVDHYAALARSFHEPNRLQILAALASSPQGLSFSELKTRCELTDGNLSRHLKTLTEVNVVRLDKAFVDAKPRTMVVLTDQGRKDFLVYLDSLEKVLRQAKAASKSVLTEAQGHKRRTA